jgi:hypothetical protein
MDGKTLTPKRMGEKPLWAQDDRDCACGKAEDESG